MLLPLLAALVLVWSTDDRRDQIGDIPVAIVNNDTIITDPQPMAAGRALTASLTNPTDGDPQLDWTLTDPDDAKDGLRTGDYYAVLTIPSDFSKAILSTGTDTPESGQLELTSNAAASPTVPYISEQVVAAAAQALGNQSTQAYLKQVYAGFNQIADGQQNAASSAQQLAGGTADLSQGASQLDQGADQLAGATGELASGASALKSGTASLSSGASRIAQGNRDLAAGAQRLSSASGRARGRRGPPGRSGERLRRPDAHRLARRGRRRERRRPALHGHRQPRRRGGAAQRPVPPGGRVGGVLRLVARGPGAGPCGRRRRPGRRPGHRRRGPRRQRAGRRRTCARGCGPRAGRWRPRPSTEPPAG